MLHSQTHLNKTNINKNYNLIKNKQHIEHNRFIPYNVHNSCYNSFTTQ